jgi:hypothetical protein
MTRISRTLAGAAAVTLALLGAQATATPASADHDTPTIHPGVMTYTDGAQCTANFIFTSGADTFIGQAAHCSGTGGSTETNGCDSGSLPLGTPVEVGGASRPGTMVYNSWLTMQAVKERDANACEYNDFALIKLDPADAGKVSPTIPVIGGPTGIDRDGVRFGEDVYSSSLRLGISQLSPKEGVSLGTSGGGWTHSVYMATPGIPGDSGSAYVNAQGQALGVLSTVAIAPLAGSNGVTDLGKALDYANSVGRQNVSLVLGGAFTGEGALVRGLIA